MKRAWALAAGALGLAVVWWSWRVVAPIGDTRLSYLNYDLYSYYYPTVEYGVAQLQQGHVPLWNSHQLAGEPFFANQQHGLLYPLNLLYGLLPTQEAFRWSAILHYTIAAVGAVYLGWTLELSTGASVVAALLFTFGGYLPGLLYLRTWLNGAVWLPLELALAIRIFAPGARLLLTLLLTVVVAAQYVGGYPLYSLLSGYCLAWFAVWQSMVLAAQRRWSQLLYANVALAIVPVLAAGLCAVQLLPMIEMTELSPRKLGALSPFAVAAQAGAGQLRTLFIPLAAPGGRASTYLGGAVLPLVVAAVFHKRARASLRSTLGFFLSLAVAAAVLAVGDATPVYSWYRALPTGMWFRFPGELVYLVIFGLSFAAGIGLDALATTRRHDPSRKWLGVAVALLALALFIRIRPTSPPFQWAGRTTSVTLIGAAALLLSGMLHKHRLAWWLLCAGIWLDLSVAFTNYFIIPDVDPERFAPPASVVRFLHDHLDTQRVYFHTAPLHAPLARLGMRFGLSTIADHESLVPLRFAEYQAQLQDGMPPSPFRPPQGGVYLDPTRKQMPLLDLLGVRYLVAFEQSPFASADEAARYPEVFSQGAARIYENPRALPRAFVVGAAQAADPSTILGRLAAPDFDSLQTALVESPEAVLTGGASRAAEISMYASERVTIRVGGDTPGLLVLTDQFYPGWEADLDGTPVRIYVADYVFRGVRVPPGTHTVTFTYAPGPFRIGFWISGLSVGIMLVAFLASRRS